MVERRSTPGATNDTATALPDGLGWYWRRPQDLWGHPLPTTHQMGGYWTQDRAANLVLDIASLARALDPTIRGPHVLVRPQAMLLACKRMGLTGEMTHDTYSAINPTDEEMRAARWSADEAMARKDDVVKLKNIGNRTGSLPPIPGTVIGEIVDLLPVLVPSLTKRVPGDWDGPGSAGRDMLRPWGG